MNADLQRGVELMGVCCRGKDWKSVWGWRHIVFALIVDLHGRNHAPEPFRFCSATSIQNKK